MVHLGKLNYLQKKKNENFRNNNNNINNNYESIAIKKIEIKNNESKVK